MCTRKVESLGLKWVALVVGVALCAGCSNSAATGDARDATTEASTAIEPFDAAASLDAGAPTLAELAQTLFVPSCVLGRCHITQAPAGELSLTGRRVTPHAALVNAPSSEVPARMRVLPFDPDASYLMEKLSVNAPSVGSSMPPMGSLPPAEIERVRRWILAGALDN